MMPVGAAPDRLRQMAALFCTLLADDDALALVAEMLAARDAERLAWQTERCAHARERQAWRRHDPLASASDEGPPA